MPEYTITVARSARRELEALPPNFARRVLSRIELLAQEPRPPGCKKLLGPNRLWRIRIGDYRVVYEIDDGRRVVDIAIVRHRREVYR